MVSAPGWLEPLRIAQSLFTQPWKLAGGTRLLWYVRHQAVRDAEISRSIKQKRDMEAQADALQRKR